MTSSTGYYKVLEEPSKGFPPQALPPTEEGDGSQAANVSGYNVPMMILPKVYLEEVKAVNINKSNQQQCFLLRITIV